MTRGADGDVQTELSTGLHRNNRTVHPTYMLSSELRYQLCSTRYAAVQINNCLKRTF